MFRLWALTLSLTALVGGQSRHDGGKRLRFWAAISVNRAIFQQGDTDSLQLRFAVVNDGESTVDPRIELSHLLINGSEPNDWSVVINKGPRSSFFPPTRTLSRFRLCVRPIFQQTRYLYD